MIEVTEAKRADISLPLLKWAGGKRWLVSRIAMMWARHSEQRLVEPFCGGMAVTLGLSPRLALLNDVNPHLMNFYRHVRSGLFITIPMELDEALYYDHRERFNRLIVTGRAGTIEAASLFYYLNRTGFNGLCRFNSKGGFNVPFGKYKSVNYRSDWSAYLEPFAGWEFSCGSFEGIALRSGDFIYADPPYDVPFTQYSQGGFGWDQQVLAAQWLAEHDGPVVLSNQATERIVGLYESLGYSLTLLDAPRRISCTGDRAPAREVLATRNL